jgi:hypothetical protein
MRYLFKIACPIVFSALMLGCNATFSVTDLVGLNKASVIQRLGKPQREKIATDGERWDYSRGADGLNTYFVFLDSDGKVSRVEQVLSETNFNRVQPGMTQAEVIDIIGDPPKRHLIGRDRGYVWSYRSFPDMCFWFQIEFGLDDIVRSVGYNRRPTGIPCR